MVSNPCKATALNVFQSKLSTWCGLRYSVYKRHLPRDLIVNHITYSASGMASVMVYTSVHTRSHTVNHIPYSSLRYCLPLLT